MRKADRCLIPNHGDEVLKVGLRVRELKSELVLQACFTALAIVLIPVHAWATDAVLLKSNETNHPLGLDVSYLEDKPGQLSQSTALKSYREGHFTKSHQSTPSFGFTTSVYWLAIELKTQKGVSKDWLFQVAYPALDSLEVDIFQGGVNIQSYRVGDRQPFNERIIHNRNFLLPVTLDEQVPTLVLIRAQQFEGDLVELPMQMIEASKLSKVETTPILIDGIYVGIMLVMGLYNLILFFLLRDKAYLFYVGYVFSTLVFMMSLRGWSYQLLWPESPGWQQTCFPFLFASIAVFVVEFSARLLSLKDTLPTVFKMIRGVEFIIVIAAILTGSIPYWLSYGVVTIYSSCIAAVALFLSGLYLWHGGSETARYYCIAFSTFVVGGVVFSASKVGWLAPTIWSEYALQFGGAIEVCLFSLALAARIKILEQESQSHLKELTTESASHARDIESFNQSLSTKLFLFGDLAHRVNNPLNVARGGTEVARTTLDSFTKTVLGFFPVAGNRTIEEQEVVDHLEKMAIKIGLSLEDSKVELNRAVAYVQDLRVIGGVNGESPDPVLLTAVVDKAMERISSDLGPKASLFLESPDKLAQQSIMGQSAVLAVALSAWFKHAFLRQVEREPIMLDAQPSDCGLYSWLRIYNQSKTSFQNHLSEELSTHDIVMGLVGQQGAEWKENRIENGTLESLSLRIASSEEAWIMLQGGTDRK